MAVCPVPNQPNGRFGDLSDEDIEAVHAVHVRGAFHVCQPAYRHPRQLAVGHLRQPEKLLRQARRMGLRAEIAGPGQGTLGARIRAARLVPYQAVIGEREAEGDGGLVAVRLRDGRRPGVVPGGELVDRIAARVAARGLALWDGDAA